MALFTLSQKTKQKQNHILTQCHLLVSFLTKVALQQSIPGWCPPVYLPSGENWPPFEVLMFGLERTLISFCDMAVAAPFKLSPVSHTALIHHTCLRLMALVVLESSKCKLPMEKR